MTFRKKVASFFYSIGSSFEGALTTSSRGNPNASLPTDAKAELPSYTRTELVRRSRYLEKNSGHIRGVLRDLKVYGIGKGIYPNVKSDSHTWNRQSADYFYRWARHCDITNRFSWKECQAMILRALIVDGEIFVIKTFDAFKRPKIQIIESHRLVSSDNNANVVDGIEFDKFCRVKAYHFLIGESGNVKRVPSNAVLHIFDAERISQARAYPQIQHTINDVIDRKEILALEKKKVKAISDIVHVIKGGNVALDGDYKVNVGSGNSDGTTPETMNRILGGKNIKIEPDESIDVHESNIPSPSFNGFIDCLDRSGSLGVLPYEFSIDPSKIGGASVRLIASKTQRYIDDMIGIIDERFNDAVWFFVIGTAITMGELPATNWWWYCTWTHPKKLTVDAGREEQQNRANVEMGLKTIEESFAECGLDFEDEMRTRANNARFILDLAGYPKDEPIPLYMLYKPSGNIQNTSTPKEEKDEDKNLEEEKKKDDKK